tara:strand:+ start:184 stop:1044 length:861 start_codon:yes stop_codon:yes gene_type:complete
MKNLIYFFEFIVVKFLFIIFRIIGYKNASDLGYVIGKLLGPIFRSKSLIVENLKKAKVFSEKNYNEIAKNVLGNYGRIFAEYPHLKNFRNDKLNNFIEIDGKEYLQKIKSENKRAVFISGHFNNFELMAMQIEKVGIDLVAIYRPLNNVFLNQTMEAIRKEHICKKQIKKGRSGTRDLIDYLKKGSSVALMIDQRVREGSKVNFFENLATTTTIPAQLIKKYNCDLVPIYIERHKKYYFKMYVSKPIEINSNKSIEEITSFLNSVLEEMIKKNLDQWIWTHDRWKK